MSIPLETRRIMARIRITEEVMRSSQPGAFAEAAAREWAEIARVFKQEYDVDWLNKLTDPDLEMDIGL